MLCQKNKDIQAQQLRVKEGFENRQILYSRRSSTCSITSLKPCTTSSSCSFSTVRGSSKSVSRKMRVIIGVLLRRKRLASSSRGRGTREIGRASCRERVE